MSPFIACQILLEIEHHSDPTCLMLDLMSVSGEVAQMFVVKALMLLLNMAIFHTDFLCTKKSIPDNNLALQYALTIIDVYYH